MTTREKLSRPFQRATGFGIGMVVLLCVSSVYADAFRLHNYFTDNMVLQRDKPIVVTGFSDKGTTVSVTYGTQEKSGKASDDGTWAITLDPMPASSKSLDLECKASGSGGKVTLRNVVVGDVLFLGRQTYVDISLKRTDEGRTAAAKYKPTGNLRAVAIKTMAAKNPQDELAKGATSGWLVIDSKTALDLSGTAFYLGRDLVQELGVPVGIVDVNMDRYFGIGWMSRKSIEDAATIYPNDKEIKWLPKWMEEQAEARDSGKAQKDLDAYCEANANRTGFIKPSLGLPPLKNPMYPSAGYNAVISPLHHVAMKGILLQLGNDYPFIAYRDLDRNGTSTVRAELNAAWGDNYAILKNGYRVTPVTLPFVPAGLRKAFGDSELPIGLILPPASDLDVYAAHNREIRELHRRTAEKEGLGLIMPGNENIPSSGQPADDKLLAERCKQWVLGSVFGNAGVTPTGPLFARMESKLTKATLYFQEGTAEGLKSTDGSLDAFEAAGPDGEFTPAEARIEGKTIRLTSEGPIQFVRYNWTDVPNQGLVNRAGLPAFPFSTDADWEFGWIPPPEQSNLPEEYSTTADKWSKSDVAIINGQIASLSGGDSAPIPINPGPIGIRAAPFGPNIIVTGIDAGTPAEGKLRVSDVIYGVNGEVFEDGPDVPYDEQYKTLSRAITYSESDAGAGTLVLSVRRGTELIDVALKLRVMGSYSSTTPYYCEKSENIVKHAESWIASRYRPESGMASEPHGMLQTDLLFLLASGTPEHQGLVRRAVYSMMAKMKPEPVTPGMQSKPWNSGHVSLLLGEYFHVTGDRNVLPYLKYQADLSSESQLKPLDETPQGKEAAQSEEVVGGWRHNYPGSPTRWQSGYGLLPHAGMGCVMGMELAKEAGLDIDEIALMRGLEHYNKGRAEYAFVLYSYNNVRRDGPPPVNPEAEAEGKLWSMNGKLGMAASLYNMVGVNDTVEICARHCVYGYNKTRSGHGGMFFNNFWTPVGAWAAGEAGFKHFMKGQMWWRELFRRSDGAFSQAGRGGVGVSYALPYVAPKQRLRMLGAPRSAFGVDAPDYLKPALDAHKRRDYAQCESFILKQLNESITPAEDMPVVNHLLEAVQTLRGSINHDLELVEALIAEGKHYYASLEVLQLKGIIAADNGRLNAILQALESPEGIARIAEHRKVCEAEKSARNAERKASSQAKQQDKWISLIAQKGKSGKGLSDTWQMQVVEHVSHAPEGWTKPRYDDREWNTATLPISWTMYHTALFRSTFKVDDKNALTALRIQGNFFQQANVVIYLNGKLVAKVDKLDRGTGTTDVLLTDYAVKLLKNGENTVAISSRHKRRWGPYRGTYKTAATVGFWVEGKMAK